MSNYRNDALNNARETVQEFRNEILEKLTESGEASSDLLNDYGRGDSWHHETHIDKLYDLTDAAELIDQLSDHEETDSGLWAGQQPKDAIGTCAAFTYGNAVYSEWVDLIEAINDEAEGILNDYSDRIDDANQAEEDNDEDYDGPDPDTLRIGREFSLSDMLDRIIAG